MHGGVQLVIIDHELRFTPAFLAAREHLRRGALGRVYLAHARVLIPAGKGTHSWWSDASLGGGALGAIGSHIIDSFRRAAAGLHAWVEAQQATVLLAMSVDCLVKRSAATLACAALCKGFQVM